MTDTIPRNGAAHRTATGETSVLSALRREAAQEFWPVLTCLVIAFLLVIMVEWIARGTSREIWQFLFSTSRPGITTVIVIALALLTIDAALGNHHISLVPAIPLLAIPALISGQKQLYLSDPLYPSDMLFGRQIIELLPTMVSARPLLAIGLVIGIIAAIAGLVWLTRLTLRHTTRMAWPARIWRLALALPLLAGFASLMEYSSYSWIRDRLQVIPMMWDQKENYRHNGFIMAFAFNLPMSNVTAPAGYNANTISEIDADGSAFAVSNSDRPDVIVIMSESLWDPTRLENMSLSPDPMPVIRSLQTGNVFSPEFGGMTANVEFEALTGFSNAFLPYGSIPYQQYIRHPVPSLATFFRGEGYSAIAMHPFEEWFWNRSQVYKNFGFEEFRSIETLPEMEKRGNFTSDEALTDQIISTVESAERPLFLFTVTLQGHGPYEENRYSSNSIALDGNLSPGATSALATYAQGVNEADRSFARLINWARKRERETVVVLFGDHLPPMGQVFQESGYMKGAVAERRAPLETMKREHETPLVVWSSKAGRIRTAGSVSPAMLPFYIVRNAGYGDPFYTGVLGEVHKTFPVVDRYMLLGADGAEMPDWQTRPDLDHASLREYRMLQYDMMFGDQHGRKRFFPAFDWLEREKSTAALAEHQESGSGS